MMKRVVFSDEIDTKQAYNLVEQRVQLVCPRCGADPKTALTYETAREKGMHGGTVCPNDPKHLQVLIEFAEPHLRMRKLFAEMQEKWELEHPDKVVK